MSRATAYQQDLQAERDLANREHLLDVNMGLDQQPTPEEREAAFEKMVAKSSAAATQGMMAGRQPTFGEGEERQTGAGAVSQYGQTPKPGGMTSVGEMATDVAKGAADVGANLARVGSDVHQWLSSRREQGMREAGDEPRPGIFETLGDTWESMRSSTLISDTVREWRANGQTPGEVIAEVDKATRPPEWLMKAGRPAERGPRTTGVAADEDYFGRAEAYIRSKVPESYDPSVARVVGQVGAEIGLLAAGGGLRAGMAVAAAGGAAIGALRDPDDEIGLAAWASEKADHQVPGLAWLADREGDSPGVKRLKNGVEEALVAVVGEKIVDNSIKLYRVATAEGGARAASQRLVEADAAERAGEAAPAPDAAPAAPEAPPAADVDPLTPQVQQVTVGGKPKTLMLAGTLRKDIAAHYRAKGRSAQDAELDAQAAAKRLSKAIGRGKSPEEARREVFGDEPAAVPRTALEDLTGEATPPPAAPTPAPKQTPTGPDTAAPAAIADEGALRSALTQYWTKRKDKLWTGVDEHVEGKVASVKADVEAGRSVKDAMESAIGKGADDEAVSAALGARAPEPEPPAAVPEEVPAERAVEGELEPEAPAPEAPTAQERLAAASTILERARRNLGVEKPEPAAPAAVEAEARAVVREAARPRTPDVDAAKADGQMYQGERTLADADTPVATEAPAPDDPAPTPPYTRPLEAWTEDERIAFTREVHEKMGRRATIGTTRGGQVTVRIGSTDHVLAGETRNGKPLFNARAYKPEDAPDEGDFLSLRLKQQEAVLANAEADVVRARAAGLMDEDVGARALAEATQRRDATQRAIGTLQWKLAERAAARQMRDADRMEELLDGDLFTLDRTSPEMLDGAVTKTQQVDASAIPAQAQDYAPLHISAQTRGSSPEDYMVERAQAEQLSGYTQKQIGRIAESLDATRATRAQWGRVRTENDVDAWVAKRTEGLKAPGPEGHQQDLGVLRWIAGESAAEGMDAKTARAWVQLMGDSANEVVRLARVSAGARHRQYEWAWDAVTAFTKHRAMIHMLRRETQEAQDLFDSIKVPRSKEEMEGLTADQQALRLQEDEARIRGKLQDVFGGQRRVEELLGQMASKTLDSEVHEAARAMRGIYKRGKARKFFDGWTRVGLAGMLSSPKTTVLAAAANSIVNVAQVPEMYLAAAIKGFFKSDAELVTWRAANADLAGRLPGMRLGLKMMAAEAETGFWGGGRMRSRLKEEGNIDLFHRMRRNQRFDLQERPYGERANPNRTKWEQLMVAGDRISRVPFTALGSVDMFAKGTAYSSYIARRAAMAADHQGLTGDAWTDFFKRSVSDPPETWIEGAIRSGEDMTFTRPWSEAERWMMVPMAALTRTIDRVPVLGRLFAMPFVTVPARSLSYALDRMPLVGFAQRRVREQWAEGGQARQMLIARQTFGGMVMSAGVLAGMSGIVTGGGSRDHRLRGVESKTRPPYSIRIAGGWYRYDRLDPIGRLLGVAADGAEVLALAPTGREAFEWGNIANVAIGAMQHHMTEGSFIASLGEFAGILSDISTGKPTEHGWGGITRFASRQAGNLVPYSSLTRSAYQGYDPVYRDTRAVVEEGATMLEWIDEHTKSLQANIPGLSGRLPSRRDAYGREVKRLSPGGQDGQGYAWAALSPVQYHDDTGDPGYKAMQFSGWAPARWPRESGGVAYTHREADLLAETGGELFRSMLARHIAGGAFEGYYRVGTPEAREMMGLEIKAIHRAALAQARKLTHSVATDWRRGRIEGKLRKARERNTVRHAIRMQGGR